MGHKGEGKHGYSIPEGATNTNVDCYLMPNASTVPSEICVYSWIYYINGGHAG